MKEAGINVSRSTEQLSPLREVLQQRGLVPGAIVHVETERRSPSGDWVSIPEGKGIKEGVLWFAIEKGSRLTLGNQKDKMDELISKVQLNDDPAKGVRIETDNYRATVTLVSLPPEDTSAVFAQGILTQEDLQREQQVFAGKGYSDLAAAAGKVRPEDDILTILLGQHDFQVGDHVRVTDADMKEPFEGVINERRMVTDKKGNPWGILGVLATGGTVEKV